MAYDAQMIIVTFGMVLLWVLSIVWTIYAIHHMKRIKPGSCECGHPHCFHYSKAAYQDAEICSVDDCDCVQYILALDKKKLKEEMELRKMAGL